MPNTKIISNKRISWRVGSVSEISDWDAPPLDNLEALDNLSGAIRIAGTTFGLQASDQTDDRTFADEAGSQVLGYANFGGNVSHKVPKSGDTTSVEGKAHEHFATDRNELAILQRFGMPEAAALAAGQEINLFHVITDAQINERSQTGYQMTTAPKPQDDNLVNYIIPAASPASVTITGPATGAVGGAAFLKAAYQGHTITLGAEWSSSDETKAIVYPHGLVRYLGAGTVTITAAYPGGTADTLDIVIS